jgi:hypothetical protein
MWASSACAATLFSCGLSCGVWWSGGVLRVTAPLAMPSTTPSMISPIRSSRKPAMASLSRERCLKRQCVQDAAHVAFKRVVDHLVLLHPALASEAFRDNLRCIVIAVSGQIADGHLGVRNPGLDEFFDIACIHWHGGRLLIGLFGGKGFGDIHEGRKPRFMGGAQCG